MGAEPDFHVDVRHDAAGFVVTPRGELDLATAQRVQAKLAERGPGEPLVLDLSGLTFLDTSGIQLVVEADRSSRAEGFEFSLRRGTPAVHRVFEIAGLDRVLPFADRGADGD